MNVIIAGSRTITDMVLIEQAIAESGFEITAVVCGMARGVDMLGRHWALGNHIPVIEYPADWDKHGRQAGFLRNVEMAKIAKGLIAVTNGSKGTQHMIDIATRYGLYVFVKEVN